MMVIILAIPMMNNRETKKQMDIWQQVYEYTNYQDIHNNIKDSFIFNLIIIVIKMNEV